MLDYISFKFAASKYLYTVYMLQALKFIVSSYFLILSLPHTSKIYFTAVLPDIFSIIISLHVSYYRADKR